MTEPLFFSASKVSHTATLATMANFLQQACKFAAGGCCSHGAGQIQSGQTEYSKAGLIKEFNCRAADPSVQFVGSLVHEPSFRTRFDDTIISYLFQEAHTTP